MTNHPGRKPGSAQQRMTPEALRQLVERAGITQARAAELSGVEQRTFERWLAGDRAMPRSASGLLCLSLILLGAPASLFLPYLPSGVAELAASRSDPV